MDQRSYPGLPVLCNVGRFSLFKKEPAWNGWVYVPLTDSYKYFFKILEQELLLILKLIRKTKPEVRSFLKKIPKKIGTRDSLIFRIKKTDVEVINKIKEPHNTRPPLLVLTAVQISSGYGSKRSLSQTPFFARWWGLGEFMDSLEIAGNLWCMGKQ
jgi:hypothetical protein